MIQSNTLVNDMSTQLKLYL